MTTDTAFAKLIKELGQRMDLGELTVDEEGACALQIDGRFVVGLHCGGADEQLWLYSDLGVAAAGSDIYPHLLRSNLFWHGTMGATLSLTHDEPPRVVLAQAVDWAREDAASLANVLESFVDSSEAWLEVVAGQNAPAADCAPIPNLLDSRA